MLWYALPGVFACSFPARTL
ncbi:MAG: hypothetical protein KDK23_01830, partial [Leptospiraceae bacterium]|nr:hypothetical protein [Leptospiraceae bacterium]